MRQLFDWFWESPHFGDRRIQACCAVVFCMVMTVVVYLSPSGKPEVDGRVIDWSFAALLGVVGIYHTARGVDELLGRRSSTTTWAQSGEMTARTETTEVPPLR
jgi:hypothetical protein